MCISYFVLTSVSYCCMLLSVHPKTLRLEQRWTGNVKTKKLFCCFNQIFQNVLHLIRAYFSSSMLRSFGTQILYNSPFFHIFLFGDWLLSSIWYCSLEKCLIFWYMPLSVVLRIASIRTVARWRVFSAMGYNAKRVPLVVVFFVKKCGIYFNYMLEHAKNLNATYRAAGL